MQAEQARLTPNEYACLQSHINVLKRLGEDNLQHACVLEDDVVLAADFSAFMDDAAQPLVHLLHAIAAAVEVDDEYGNTRHGEP